MTTQNNWLSSNIASRLTDPEADFVVHINKQPYGKIPFVEACHQVCRKINDIGKTIYIGLSGGFDSEFVFRKFMSLGYDVKPIIVCTTGNQHETPMAFDLCQELNVTPIVIEKTEVEYLQIIYRDIFKKLNGYGVATPGPILGGMYAQEHGGIFIKSEHLIDEREGKMYVGANEWDFYNDALIGIDNTYYFFFHTPEIVYSMISAMEGESVQRFKADIYQLPYREKIKFESYSPLFAKSLKVIRSKRVSRPKYNYDFGSKETFLQEYF